jgi:hypothetical protein
MSKERITDLAKQLRDAARMQDPVARAAIELVKLSSDAAKESLVTAEGDGILRAQGEARAMARLHRELTTIPPSITSAAGDN